MNDEAGHFLLAATFLVTVYVVVATMILNGQPFYLQSRSQFSIGSLFLLFS